MPALAWMQLYHSEKPACARVFCTKPGWCLILACVFFGVNTVFVLLDTFAEQDESGEFSRACAPISI
jgi:hypothetical protein